MKFYIAYYWVTTGAFAAVNAFLSTYEYRYSNNNLMSKRHNSALLVTAEWLEHPENIDYNINNNFNNNNINNDDNDNPNDGDEMMFNEWNNAYNTNDYNRNSADHDWAFNRNKIVTGRVCPMDKPQRMFVGDHNKDRTCFKWATTRDARLEHHMDDNTADCYTSSQSTNTGPSNYLDELQQQQSYSNNKAPSVAQGIPDSNWAFDNTSVITGRVDPASSNRPLDSPVSHGASSFYVENPTISSSSVPSNGKDNEGTRPQVSTEDESICFSWAFDEKIVVDRISPIKNPTITNNTANGSNGSISFPLTQTFVYDANVASKLGGESNLRRPFNEESDSFSWALGGNFGVGRGSITTSPSFAEATSGRSNCSSSFVINPAVTLSSDYANNSIPTNCLNNEAMNKDMPDANCFSWAFDPNVITGRTKPMKKKSNIGQSFFVDSTAKESSNSNMNGNSVSSGSSNNTIKTATAPDPTRSFSWAINSENVSTGCVSPKKNNDTNGNTDIISRRHLTDKALNPSQQSVNRIPNNDYRSTVNFSNGSVGIHNAEKKKRSPSFVSDPACFNWATDRDNVVLGRTKPMEKKKLKTVTAKQASSDCVTVSEEIPITSKTEDSTDAVINGCNNSFVNFKRW